MRLIYIPLFIIGLIFCQCVDEIDPIVVDQNRVVIIGNLYYPSDVLEIEIIRSTNTITYEKKPITNAQIRLKKQGDLGDELVDDSFTYSPQDESYQSQSSIPTEIGTKYWIEVEIPGEKGVFISEPVEMLAPVPIQEIERINGATRIVFQDPLSIGTEVDQNLYLAIFRYLENDDEVDTEYVPSTDRLFDGNEQAFIENFSIYGNGIDVDLYHLDPGTYNYFLRYNTQLNENEGIDDQSGDPGFLFRNPPVQLTGNIYNSVSQDAVLGNFGVVAISSRSKSF